MWPEPAELGAAITILVEVTEVGTIAGVVFTISRSFCGAISKFVPLTVTAPPASTTAGEKPLIVGEPPPDVTVKLAALVAEPAVEVNVIGPVEAPGGTVATI